MASAHDCARDVVRSLKRLGKNDQVMLSGLAVVAGAASGIAAIAFRYGISLVQTAAFGFGTEDLVTNLAALPWWQVVLPPAVGGLIIGLFIRFAMPGRRPHGVAQVIEANALRDGRMSLTVGIKAAAASAASLGVGASVGREGPVVHLGACLGAWIAGRLRLGRALSRTLLGCGVAAAIAASFNAPMAGVFFALEVVIGHYALSAFAPVVIASVTGTIISHMHYGNFPAFTLPGSWSITSFFEFPAFALLGVVSALGAIIFMRSIFFTEDLFSRVPLPRWTHPAVGGLLIGVMAIEYPHVLGVGYEATDMALSDLLPLWLLLLLIVLKTAATAISLGSGFSGGVFSPSLFVGAMVGGSFGVIATSMFPHLSSGHGAYTLIGMGAVAGSVLGAPISTILMIFELTTDYALTIAVMIATVIASVITQQATGESFFTWQLKRMGVSVRGGNEIGLLRRIEVKSVLDPTYEKVTPDAPIGEVRERLRQAPWGELFVVDDDGRLTATVTFSDLADVAFDTSRDTSLVAADLARQRPSALQARDDLETALRKFGTYGEGHVAVVDSYDSMKMLGVAHEHQVVLAYRRAVEQARAEERGEG